MRNIIYTKYNQGSTLRKCTFFFFLFFKESSESVNHIINVQGTILQSHNNILGVL